MNLWANFWYQTVKETFINSYLKTIEEKEKERNFTLFPKDKEDFNLWLNAFILEKFVYELANEINAKSNYFIIPCKGILSLITQLKGS